MPDVREFRDDLRRAESSSGKREVCQAYGNWSIRWDDGETGIFAKEQIKYLFIEGVNFDMRIGDSIEKAPVLVAIVIIESGRRLIVGLQTGDKESASSWREFFKDLKRRGLDGAKVTMGIVDGLPGLEKVFAESSPQRKCSAARFMSGATFWPRCHGN